MTFTIGNQSAGNINNVARDQHITGGQQGILVTPEAARQAGVRRPQPVPAQVAPALERLTRLLLAAGSLATAGSAVLQPLHTLATWLGALGRPVLHLLPVLL